MARALEELFSLILSDKPTTRHGPRWADGRNSL